MCVIGPNFFKLHVPFAQLGGWGYEIHFSSVIFRSSDNILKKLMLRIFGHPKRSTHLLNWTRIAELVGGRSPDWASRPGAWPIYLVEKNYSKIFGICFIIWYFIWSDPASWFVLLRKQILLWFFRTKTSLFDWLTSFWLCIKCIRHGFNFFRLHIDWLVSLYCCNRFKTKNNFTFYLESA